MLLSYGTNLCLGVSLKILAMFYHVAASILRWFIILFIIVMWCVSAVFSHFFPKAQSVAISVSESRRGCCQAGSTDEMWSGAGRRRAIGSDQARGWARVWSASPSADWTCHPAGVVPASYPADDYSVSKLTLCWTFLSPTICVSTVGKKEVDDWADYQKLFFAFRGRWPILPHIFILLHLIFILIEKHRSKYFRPSTHFSHMLRRSQYLIVSLCTWNLCPSFLTIEFANSGRDQTSFLTFVFHLALELWAWIFFATGWKFMADLFLFSLELVFNLTLERLREGDCLPSKLDVCCPRLDLCGTNERTGMPIMEIPFTINSRDRDTAPPYTKCRASFRSYSLPPAFHLLSLCHIIRVNNYLQLHL